MLNYDITTYKVGEIRNAPPLKTSFPLCTAKISVSDTRKVLLDSLKQVALKSPLSISLNLTNAKIYRRKVPPTLVIQVFSSWICFHCFSPVLGFPSWWKTNSEDLFYNSLEHNVPQLNQHMNRYFSFSIASI